MDDVVALDPGAPRRTPQRRRITGRTRVCAVIGSPITHSLSPVIHNAAFEATGLDWTYVALPVHDKGAGGTIAAAWQLGLSGLSVTMPYKQVAAEVAVTRAPLVAEMGAANTLVSTEDGWHAENTDVDGMVAFCTRDLGLDLDGARAGIVGGGGAAAAVAVAMRVAGAKVVVWNRTAANAAAVAALAGDGAVVADDASVLDSCDLVVSCVPSSVAVELCPGVSFHEDQTLVDLVYSPPHTPLMELAAAGGADVHNGLGLLVNQAALQFELWTGRLAPIEVMSAAALAEVGVQK